MIDRIKKLCQEQGITFHKLEMECGFANGYLARINENKMPADRALVISKYLGTTLDYLITGNETSKIPDYDPRFFEIIDMFGNLDEAQKMAVMIIMKGMQK